MTPDKAAAGSVSGLSQMSTASQLKLLTVEEAGQAVQAKRKEVEDAEANLVGVLAKKQKVLEEEQIAREKVTNSRLEERAAIDGLVQASLTPVVVEEEEDN